MRILLKSLMCLLLCLGSLAGLAGVPPVGGPPPGRLAFKVYGSEQGLGNLAVWALLQDRQGFMWVGTEGGLYRYNDQKFRAFGLSEGLPSTYIECLHEDAGGTFWVGTYQGLARGVRGRFETMGPERGLPTVPIHSIASGPGGRLWVGTSQGPFLLGDGGRFEAVPGWPGGSVSALWSQSSSESVWIASWGASGARVLRWSKGQWQELGGGPDFNRQRVDALAMDAKGRVWARTLHNLYMLAAGGAQFQPCSFPVPAVKQKGALYLDHENALWAITEQGLLRLDDGGRTHLGVAEGLPEDDIHALFRDREGSLWLGGRGVYRLQGGGVWQAYTTYHGLPSDTVWCIVRDRSGRLLAGTDGGLGQATPTGWKLVSGTGRFQVRSLVEGPDGSFFMAGAPPEVIRWDPKRDAFTRFGREAGVIAEGRIFRLLFDREGQLWAATDGGGLLRGQGKGEAWTFTREPLPGGNPEESIHDLFLDSVGRLWAAGDRGLAVREGGRWRRLTAQDGLRRDAVSYVCGRRDGSLVVAYFDLFGLSEFRYEGGKLQVLDHLDSAHGLAADKVYLIGEDAQGNLWVGTGMGVDLVHPDRRIEHFGRGDGLVGEDIDAQAFRAEPGGDVWIGTSAGLAKFNARTHQGVNQPPASVILGFRFGDAPFAPYLGGRIKVFHGANTLEVQYAGLSYIREGAVQQEVRLVGLEPKWRLTESRTQRYPALAPGKYRFEVRSRIGQGEWGPVEALDFQVMAAWWQTWWFRGLSVLAFALLGALAVWGRVAALHRRNRLLEGMVAQRTEELAKANEALQNQSLTDPLTGLRNRRYLSVCMPEDVAQVKRVHRDANAGRKDRMALNIDLIFIMVDIDHFKAVNDQYGHAAGDRVLQQVAEIIRIATRDSDTVVRWGGEEFLVVARNASRCEGTILVERIRSQVAAHEFDLGSGGKTIHRSCSLGFTFFPFLPERPDLFPWERVIDLADHCLYAAKRGGRDAWVGVFPNGTSDPEVFLGAIPLEVDRLIQEGHLTLKTSFPEGHAMTWEMEA